MSEELIVKIYNAIAPFRPLGPDDRQYVPCHRVRGDENIWVELGRKIVRSAEPVYQLYAGHRGVGKSTELLRLKQKLEENGCFVVYFAADADIDTEDARYTDVLLACVRNLVEALQEQSDPGPLLRWGQARWEELADMGQRSVDLGEEQKVTAAIPFLGRLTAALKTVPSQREEIRKKIDIHTPSLIEELNLFIERAAKSLGDRKIVVIADNLDRIVPIGKPDGLNNHDEIFIDRSSQLTALECHVIYTVPISMIYSERVAQLRNNYGDCPVLPMIEVCKRGSEEKNTAGIETLKQVIWKRIEEFGPSLKLVPDIFESEAALENLCLQSGGHLREFMLLLQGAIDRTEQLPISAGAIQRAIGNTKLSYCDAVSESDWEKLIAVDRSNEIDNDDEYRKLLFSRCVLEYRELGPDNEPKRWHAVNPMIKSSEKFAQKQQELEERAARDEEQTEQ